jgi:hypothetical protein
MNPVRRKIGGAPVLRRRIAKNELMRARVVRDDLRLAGQREIGKARVGDFDRRMQAGGRRITSATE